MPAWPVKRPDEVLDYIYDWTARLTADEDTIEGAPTVTVASGSALIASDPAPSVADGKVTCWITGGANGETCTVKVEVSTAGGRIYEALVDLPILA